MWGQRTATGRLPGPRRSGEASQNRRRLSSGRSEARELPRGIAPASGGRVCQGPGAGLRPPCRGSSREAHVAGAECARGREGGTMAGAAAQGPWARQDLGFGPAGRGSRRGQCARQDAPTPCSGAPSGGRAQTGRGGWGGAGRGDLGGVCREKGGNDGPHREPLPAPRSLGSGSLPVPRSLSPGPPAEQLTQGCLPLPGPSRQARRLRPGPPRMVSLPINSKSPDLGRTVTSGNHVVPTQGRYTGCVHKVGHPGATSGSGPVDGPKVEGARD